ncbi:MAG: hypothetical protein KKF89_04975 [Nanoarchaeota archaeon]|nr:hypothetical protein [Nanoarchaeota archaeon]MBU1855047.1 hypothetical protein [Nanoarchaeota archaeon]
MTKKSFLIVLILIFIAIASSFSSAVVDCSPAPPGTIGGSGSCGLNSDDDSPMYESPYLVAVYDSRNTPCSSKCADSDFGCTKAGGTYIVKCWSTDDFIVGDSCDYYFYGSGRGVVNEHGYCVEPYTEASCGGTNSVTCGIITQANCNYVSGCYWYSGPSQCFPYDSVPSCSNQDSQGCGVLTACSWLKGDGEVCSAGSECASDFCIEGVCRVSCFFNYYGDSCSDDSNAYNSAGGGVCARNYDDTSSICDKDEVAQDYGTYSDCYEVFNGAPTYVASCDSDVSNGYLQDGICAYYTGSVSTSSVNCDTSIACFDDANYRADCSYCSISSSDIDKCDSNSLADGFNANGYCALDSNDDTSCVTGVVSNIAGTLTEGCPTNGVPCDIDAYGNEDGAFSTAANGVCVVGETCEKYDIVIDSGIYYKGCSGHGGKKCDNSLSPYGVFAQSSLCWDNGVSSDCENDYFFIFYDSSSGFYLSSDDVVPGHYYSDSFSGGVSCDSTFTAGGDYSPDGMIVSVDDTFECLSSGEVDESVVVSIKPGIDNDYFISGCDILAMGDSCDSDITASLTPFSRDGSCCFETCYVDGSVGLNENCCDVDSVCSDTPNKMSCYGEGFDSLCKRDDGESCASGDDCGNSLCVEGTCQPVSYSTCGQRCSIDTSSYTSSSRTTQGGTETSIENRCTTKLGEGAGDCDCIENCQSGLSCVHTINGAVTPVNCGFSSPWVYGACTDVMNLDDSHFCGAACGDLAGSNAQCPLEPGCFDCMKIPHATGTCSAGACECEVGYTFINGVCAVVDEPIVYVPTTDESNPASFVMKGENVCNAIKTDYPLSTCVGIQENPRNTGIIDHNGWVDSTATCSDSSYSTDYAYRAVCQISGFTQDGGVCSGTNSVTCGIIAQANCNYVSGCYWYSGPSQCFPYDSVPSCSNQNSQGCGVLTACTWNDYDTSCTAGTDCLSGLCINGVCADFSASTCGLECSFSELSYNEPSCGGYVTGGECWDIPLDEFSVCKDLPLSLCTAGVGCSFSAMSGCYDYYGEGVQCTADDKDDCITLGCSWHESENICSLITTESNCITANCRWSQLTTQGGTETRASNKCTPKWLEGEGDCDCDNNCGSGLDCVWTINRGPDGEYGVAGVDDDNNLVIDDFSEYQWFGSDDVSLYSIGYCQGPINQVSSCSDITDAQLCKEFGCSFTYSPDLVCYGAVGQTIFKPEDVTNWKVCEVLGGQWKKYNEYPLISGFCTDFQENSHFCGSACDLGNPESEYLINPRPEGCYDCSAFKESTGTCSNGFCDCVDFFLMHDETPFCVECLDDDDCPEGRFCVDNSCFDPTYSISYQIEKNLKSSKFLELDYEIISIDPFVNLSYNILRDNSITKPQSLPKKIGRNVVVVNMNLLEGLDDCKTVSVSEEVLEKVRFYFDGEYSYVNSTIVLSTPMCDIDTTCYKVSKLIPIDYCEDNSIVYSSVSVDVTSPWSYQCYRNYYNYNCEGISHSVAIDCNVCDSDSDNLDIIDFNVHTKEPLEGQIKEILNFKINRIELSSPHFWVPYGDDYSSSYYVTNPDKIDSQKITTEIDYYDSYHYSKSMKFSVNPLEGNNEFDKGLITELIDVLPDKTYTASAWMKTGVTSGPVYFKVYCHNGLHTGGDCHYNNGVCGYTILDSNEDWTLLDLTFTTDADADHCHMTSYFEPSDYGTFWIDAVQFEKRSYPSSFSSSFSSADKKYSLIYYDNADRVKSVTKFDGSTIYYGYGFVKFENPDNFRYTIDYDDELGRRYSYLYDPLFRLRRVVSPMSGVADFEYDSLGNLIQITNEVDSNPILFDYNEQGKIKSLEQIDIGIISYDYNLLSQLENVTFNNVDSQVLSFENGRLKEVKYN